MTAPAELVIEVTAEDIRLGQRSSVCLCPVARAAYRLLGKPLPSDDQVGAALAVYGGGVDVWTGEGNSGWDTYLIPDEAADFIQAFDNGREVAPFTFTARMEAS